MNSELKQAGEAEMAAPSMYAEAAHSSRAECDCELYLLQCVGIGDPCLKKRLLENRLGIEVFQTHD